MKSIALISLLAMVLLAQGCTVNIGTSPESSLVVEEPNQKLSFISAPLQAINLLKDYGAPCKYRINTVEDDFSTSSFYRVSCLKGEDIIGTFVVDIFDSEASFYEDRDALCQSILPENRKSLPVLAFGKNWISTFLLPTNEITISDVAFALGGQTSDDPASRCQFQE